MVDSRHGDRPPVADPPANFGVVRVPGSERLLKLRWLAGLGPSVTAAAGPLDLFHSPHVDHMASGATPRVLTVHDLCFLTHPAFFPWKDRVLHQLGLRRSLSGARLVIAVSEATAAAVREHLGLAADRIRVIPEAPAAVFAAAPALAAVEAARRLSGDAPYALFVGTLEPRKDVTGLVQAFTLARRRAGLPHRLLIVGRPGWKSAPLLTAADAGAAAGVVRLGYLTDEVVAALMAAAGCFVYPSLAEGFGLPVLEAMAAGAPVVISDARALVEVSGGAAEVVPAGDPEALAARLADVLGDAARQAHLAARGRRRAAEFSWDGTARATLAAYSEAA